MATSNPNRQSVQAFSGTGSSFSYVAPVYPAPGSTPSSFALSLGIDAQGTTAVVEGAVTGTATEWVFTKTGVNWFPGPSFPSAESGDVVIDASTIVVGGTFAAYVYSTSGGSPQTLTAPDFTTGSQTGYFGAPIAISGDTLLVTGQQYDSSFELGHFGYIFSKVGSTWTQQAKLVPSDLSTGNRLSFHVALDGSTAVLATSVGAYVFSRTGTSWAQVQKISVPSTATSFGSAVALSGDSMVIGGTGAQVGAPGAAYVYGRSNGTWTLGPTLVSGSTDANTDFFGQSVAVHAGTIAVAAPSASSGGAVYLFACQPD